MSAWWKRYTNKKSRLPYPQPAEARPLLQVGTVVRLKGKPDRPRRVLEAQWHWIRREFVYVVETSARTTPYVFKPYWFSDQLQVEQPTDGNAPIP
jgi:hypothetical protein